MVNRSPLRRRYSRGFTLIEVLISLAITAMVVSVLMGSVFYGAKVQSAIQRELVDREKLLRAKAWFTEALGSCLPADAESGAAFAGTAQLIRCDSVMPLQGARFLPAQRVQWSLRASPNLGEAAGQQLVYRQAGAATEQVLFELPAGQAAFSYVGTDGNEVAAWPVVRNGPETLPRRIHLKVKAQGGDSADFEWIASVRASPWLEQVLKNPFGMVLPK
jgi:prepilin-type N-terminal cleavage/methylation domain-containing protein